MRSSLLNPLDWVHLMSLFSIFGTPLFSQQCNYHARPVLHDPLSAITCTHVIL